jgi:hypothetical protein
MTQYKNEKVDFENFKKANNIFVRKVYEDKPTLKHVGQYTSTNKRGITFFK